MALVVETLVPRATRAEAEQFDANSAVILMDESDRQARLEQARCLLQRVCDETGRATLPLRHEATCFRWTPRQPV